MEQAGFSFEGRLHISDRAHLILPHHRWREQEEEKKQKIGTTMRGIGPCYEDKAARRGFRVCDLMQSDFESQLRELYGGKQEANEFLSRIPEFRREFGKYICNCSALLSEAITQGKTILFESAQGTMLDRSSPGPFLGGPFLPIAGKLLPPSL